MPMHRFSSFIIVVGDGILDPRPDCIRRHFTASHIPMEKCPTSYRTLQDLGALSSRPK